MLGGNETANDGDYLGEEGFLYPKLSVDDVALKMQADTTQVQIKESNVPLYKSDQFKKAIKDWIAMQLFEREERLRFELQKAERRILSTFGYMQNITYGGGNVV